jgi:hypothetical protein
MGFANLPGSRLIVGVGEIVNMVWIAEVFRELISVPPPLPRC